FQAEDGIRDGHVTGVQTCALPIYRDGQNQQVERHADFQIIAESIAAWAVYHQIRLITDGRGETGGGGHHDRNDEGEIAHVELLEIGRASCRKERECRGWRSVKERK